jgi:hypothetical protein
MIGGDRDHIRRQGPTALILRSSYTTAKFSIVAAADIERRSDPMLAVMREVSDALTVIDHLSFEVGRLGKYLSNVAGEAEIALAFVLPELAVWRKLSRMAPRRSDRRRCRSNPSRPSSRRGR